MRRRKSPGDRARVLLHGLALAGAALAGGVNLARADLPFGWSVEIFAGRIVDIETAGGILACASDGGLLLYDPGQSEFHQIADAGCTDERCLRSNRLTSVARDSRGRYWVGTRASGVSQLRPEAGGMEYAHFFVGSLRPGSGLLSDSVTAVAPWRDQAVYVATPAGVAQIDLAGEVGEYNEESSRRRGLEGFPDAAVLDVAVDSAYVWAATESGVLRYRRLPPHDVEILGDSLLGTRVNSIVLQGGEIWIGTDQGVQRWNESGRYWMHLRNEPGTEPTPRFNAYGFVVRAVDPQHPRVTVGSDLDVREYNGFVWTRCNPPPLFLLEQREFRAVAITGDTLWTSQVNDNGEGAFLEVRDASAGCAWNRIAPSSIPAGPVKFVGLDRNNRDLWVGTQISGIARRSLNGVWCEYNGNEPDVRANMTDPVGRVSAFLVDRSSAIWFTTLPLEAQGTVDILRGDAACAHATDLWEHIAPGEAGFGGRYWEIAEDGAGNRFFLSDGHEVSPGGLEVLAADFSDTLNLRADLLGGSTVGAIGFDRRDGVWRFAYVGMNNLGERGLLEWINSNDLFRPGPTNFSQLPLRLPDGTFHSVSEYRDIVRDADTGDLWVATGQGIFRYDRSRREIARLVGVKSFREAGLLSLDVRDLELDDLGNLWIATDKGLNRIRAADSLLAVDAFTTRSVIDELNAEAGGAALYLPQRTLAPLPDPRVTSLAFDRVERLLTMATEGGVATLDVVALDVRPLVPIERAVVYPNPIRALGDDAAVYVGDVTLPADVVVYNLEGEIVSEKRVTFPGVAAWDLRIVVNDGSQSSRFFPATSGVYLVRVSNDAGTKVAPLVVIR